MTLEMARYDGESFAALYCEFRPRVFGLCRYMLGSHEEADDATSDVFLRLPRAIETYDRRWPFSQWLSSVTGHHCVDLLRRRQAERRHLTPAGLDYAELQSTSCSPLDRLLAAERGSAVRAAVARLPEIYRRPLLLRYYDEMTYAEISEALTLSKGTVKTRIFRAKKELQRAISFS
jgi:RNA polymerase sigma-70 factor, ECF subfamily